MVNIDEAKAHFSQLLDRVAKGEHIIIADNGRAIAEIRPFIRQLKERHLGELKGAVYIADDFNAPMSEAELAEWER